MKCIKEDNIIMSGTDLVLLIEGGKTKILDYNSKDVSELSLISLNERNNELEIRLFVDESRTTLRNTSHSLYINLKSKEETVQAEDMPDFVAISRFTQG